MSLRQSSHRPPCQPAYAVKRLWVLLLLSGSAMVVLPGCSGCSGDEQQQAEEEEDEEETKEEEQKKEQQEKPPFEKSLMKAMPYDDRGISPGVKQGHWIAVHQGIKANEGDFNGSLQFTPIDRRGSPIDLEDTPFQINLSRPVNLPKDQVKQIDLTLYAPPTTGNTRLQGGLVSPVGREVAPAIEEFRPLAAHEYIFAVLAKEPDRYSYLPFMHWARAPAAHSIQGETYYHVVRPDLETVVPLSENMLTWTAVAYVLWDNVDPDLLSTDQQRALLDWLHWGGQLIVSGPDSLDSLRGSFLAPYLPATAGESVDLAAGDLAGLSQAFAPKLKSGDVKHLPVAQAWSGITLQTTEPKTDADVLFRAADGKPLVVERRTGRGRVVVTAFRLTESELVNWPGYDSFFNACLLRRPPREYRISGGEFRQVSLDWQDVGGRQRDPRFITNLRLFSRDSGYEYRQPQERYDEFGGLILDPQTPTQSLGGWTDFSDVANAARDTLTEAAGIEIPDAGFVVRVLAVYLIIVVPVNWLFFRLIGRVEWAWGAALVIAVAYAVLVIRLAQLDIGFARSKTELAVLEVQPGYDRAHLTRYTALYTSLSSHYDLAYADRHAVAQPFAIERDYIRQTGETSREVRYRQDSQATLSNIPVLSNRTGLVHSEQMFDLGGSFTYTPGATNSIDHSVSNGTSRALNNAVLISKGDEKRLRVGWIGELAAGATAHAEMEEIDATELLTWYHSHVPPVENDPSEAVPLNLIRLVDVCLRGGEFDVNDVRLVGTLDDPQQQGLVGTSVSPGSRQARFGTTVLAHLQYAELPAPRRDANARQDFDGIEGTVNPDFDASDGLSLP